MPRLFELSSPPGGHEAAADHRYRSLIEQSPVGITISRAARFEYLNEAAVALFGYDNAAELIGESVLTIVAPECHELVMDYYARRNRGEPAPSAYDYIVVRKDGSR